MVVSAYCHLCQEKRGLEHYNEMCFAFTFFCKRSDQDGKAVPSFGSFRIVLWELRRISDCYLLSLMRKETKRLKERGS